MSDTEKLKVCQWMVEAKDWKDCGDPVAFIHEATTLCYCQKHAEAFKGTQRLKRLNPESR